MFTGSEPHTKLVCMWQVTIIMWSHL